MWKKYPVIKWSVLGLVGIIVGVIAFGYWFLSLIPSQNEQKDLTTIYPNDLSYLTSGSIHPKGKVLAVVTSCNVMGSSEKPTGYELTELARTYYVLQANGFEVDIASPKGGDPPVVIDWDDMGAFDYAFLNDSVAQFKTHHTISMDQVDCDDYKAVFFVGGKGAMFDFPDNPFIIELVREYYNSDKVIGAVCHGPAALLNVTLEDGSSLLDGKSVCSFTNEEELFLIANAREIFPFLLEDALIERNAQFTGGPRYLEQINIDGNLVTGQNPWSTWAFAEAMVMQMGFNPKPRVATAEENTIEILSTYESAGIKEARAQVEYMLKRNDKSVDRNLLAIHGILAAMQWNFSKVYDILGLLVYAKDLSAN